MIKLYDILRLISTKKSLINLNVMIVMCVCVVLQIQNMQTFYKQMILLEKS